MSWKVSCALAVVMSCSLVACATEEEDVDSSSDELSWASGRTSEGRQTSSGSGSSSSRTPGAAAPRDQRLTYVACAARGCDPGYHVGALTFSGTCGSGIEKNAHYCVPTPDSDDYSTCSLSCTGAGTYVKRHHWAATCGEYKIPASSSVVYVNAAECGHYRSGQSYYSCSGCGPGFSARGTGGGIRTCYGSSPATYCVPTR